MKFWKKVAIAWIIGFVILMIFAILNAAVRVEYVTKKDASVEGVSFSSVII